MERNIESHGRYKENERKVDIIGESLVSHPVPSHLILFPFIIRLTLSRLITSLSFAGLLED